MALSSSHHETRVSNYSLQELWNQVQGPSFASCAPEDAWLGPNKYFASPEKNIWGNPILPPFSYSYSAKPKNIDSFPFIPFTSSAPEDIWYPPKTSYNLYSSEATEQSDNLSHGAEKPNEDMSTIVASDEHVRGSLLNIDAGTMNTTCDSGFNKPLADVGSSKPPSDGILFSGSEDGSRAHDNSAGACYLCGEAEHFARKCSLGCDYGNGTT